MLNELSQLQETYRSIFRSLYKEEDGNEDIRTQEDSVVAVCVANHAMGHAEFIEPTEDDVLSAIEFLDHLDTLNFVVGSK